MTISKTMRFSAIILAVVLVCLSGCTNKNKTSASVNFAGTPWEVTEYNMSEIVDENGQYITEKLTSATVSELKTVGEKQVIYHLGKPFLMRGMHFRYDHLETARDYEYSPNKINDDELKQIFDEGMRHIKESGFNTVSIYLSLGGMYDGENVDFSLLEYQYSVAKKYDLNIVITWFGHMVCGFGGYQSWQTQNSERYPALKDENGNILYVDNDPKQKMIPDFSGVGFIEDEAYVLQQICAWLNVNDTERRTVGIQIEDEPNNEEGGHGLWYSQYENVRDFIGEMAKAVKQSSYSMLTYTTLMSSGWDQPDDTFKNQILGFINLPYLDSTGYGSYTTSSTPHISNIEQSDNPRFMVGFGCCQWNVPAQTNYLLSRGYGMCYYMLHLYKFDSNQNPNTTGLFYFKDKNNAFVYRDGSQILAGEYKGELEVVASEFIMMNHSILDLAELIAVSPNANMTYFNNYMETDFSESKSLDGKTFTFETFCSNDRYGATALLIKADDSTYYTYASKTATITVSGGIKSASEGVYKDGKWVKTKDVDIIDGKFTFEAGKAYQFIIA